jgi:hypothetical protein
MKSRRKLAQGYRRRTAMLTRTLLLVTLASSQFARAESPHDMLLFLSVEGVEMFSASDPMLEVGDVHATADFLYTYNSDRFRFLAEYIWSDTEAELERLQAAWVIDDESILWFGRFHAISNYWASEYHHGQYMQTSISRPALAEWEDESGPIPSHVTGAWFEHEIGLANQSALDFGLAAGLAPRFEGQQLEPFDVLDPDSDHDLAVTGRLVYRPDILSLNQIGMTISQNDIAVVSESHPSLANLNAIRQATLGVFASWQWDKWRLSSNLMYFDIDMQYGDGTVNDEFLLGYVQAEYEASEEWTVFGRTEFSDSEDDSIYLSLLPGFVAHRQMLGVRWDVADRHALTLEVADTSLQADTVRHDSFKEVRLQWAAVIR